MNKVPLTILCIMIAIFSISLFFIYPVNEMNLDIRLGGVSSSHILGTDSLGRDVYSRLTIGFFISLYIGFSSALITIVAATIIALLIRGTIVDNLVITIFDGLKTIPGILLSAILLVLFGPSLLNVQIVIILIFLPQCLRIIRSRIIVVETQDFVVQKIALGIGEKTLLFKTILPHIKDEALMQFGFIFSSSILLESTLSFIGAGLDLSIPSLGNIIAEARLYIYKEPIITIAPVVVIVLLTLCFNILFKAKDK